MKVIKTMSLLLALALSAMMFAGCKETPLEFKYNVTIVGDADGDVAVNFPDGTLDLKGTAGLNFRYGNVEPNLKAAKLSNEQYTEIAEAAFRAIDEEFSAVAAKGTYYLHIKGECYESVTGAKISIDKTLTNRE